MSKILNQVLNFFHHIEERCYPMLLPILPSGGIPNHDGTTDWRNYMQPKGCPEQLPQTSQKTKFVLRRHYSQSIQICLIHGLIQPKLDGSDTCYLNRLPTYSDLGAEKIPKAPNPAKLQNPTPSIVQIHNP